jgi:tetrahydromethanopterin S-methyltransferase subunit F
VSHHDEPPTERHYRAGVAVGAVAAAVLIVALVVLFFKEV